METVFSSLKPRGQGRIYRTRDDARADMFDYIERFYNSTRRQSTSGYLSLGWETGHASLTECPCREHNPAVGDALEVRVTRGAITVSLLPRSSATTAIN